jgi:hypothetical protein
MVVSDEALRQIALHGQADAPREACGVLSGGLVIPCANVSLFPKKRFEIAASVWLEHEVEGFYHSHPTGELGFSPQDLQVAQFLRLPSIVYIVATDTIELLSVDGSISRFEKVLTK